MQLVDYLCIHAITDMKYLSNIHNILDNITYLYIFFCQGFLSRTFTIHRTTGKLAGYIFKSSLPLPPTSQTFQKH